VARFRCREVRRALYEDDHKLITVGDAPEELYNVRDDPAELSNRIAAMPELADHLNRRLQGVLAEAFARRPSQIPSPDVKLDGNQLLSERLRRLGYIE
jgi:arylsulfatase A-like enzyme